LQHLCLSFLLLAVAVVVVGLELVLEELIVGQERGYLDLLHFPVLGSAAVWELSVVSESEPVLSAWVVRLAGQPVLVGLLGEPAAAGKDRLHFPAAGLRQEHQIVERKLVCLSFLLLLVVVVVGLELVLEELIAGRERGNLDLLRYPVLDSAAV